MAQDTTPVRLTGDGDGGATWRREAHPLTRLRVLARVELDVKRGALDQRTLTRHGALSQAATAALDLGLLSAHDGKRVLAQRLLPVKGLRPEESCQIGGRGIAK